MNAALPDLIRSRRAFFMFLIKRAILGSGISVIVVGLFLWADIGGVTSLMLRASDSWLWFLFFGFDFWVTVTGITIAIGLWNLGSWRDPPG